MIGTFPPPIHGMSTINQLMFERLAMGGWDIEKINTSPRRPSSSERRSRLSHMGTSFLAWGYLQRNLSHQSVTYLGLSGGWGQIYNIITVLISRLRGARCILHYHSAACLDKKRFTTQVLVKAAGKNAIHVALCEGMKAQLEHKYGCKHVIVLSNLALLGSAATSSDAKNLETVGYLSNITREKGGWIIIELANQIRKQGLPIKFKVAGPCLDPELRHALQEADKQDSLKWLGPVYAGSKADFWQSIDFFVFPTCYEHEAEPLVVWEALNAGVPVLAYDRGCIADQVGAAGQVIAKDAQFVEQAISILRSYLSAPEAYATCIQQAARQCANATARSDLQWRLFKDSLDSLR